MAWRKPVSRDLTAKLNQSELSAFNRHPDFATMANPAEDILSQTAEFVRGFCRTNKQVRLSPEEGTIPDGLVSPAMDVAVFDVLKRINVQPNEARKAAWEKALELFERVGRGEYIPESWVADPSGGDDTSSNRATPGFTDGGRFRILNAYPQL